jgi:hypothetical protein
MTSRDSERGNLNLLFSHLHAFSAASHKTQHRLLPVWKFESLFRGSLEFRNYDQLAHALGIFDLERRPGYFVNA